MWLIIGVLVMFLWNVPQLYFAKFEIQDMMAPNPTKSELLRMCFITPIVEEIIFRGMIFNYSLYFGYYFALVITVLLFVLSHGDIIADVRETQNMFNISALFKLIVVGIILQLVATHNFWYAVILHCALNAVGIFVVIKKLNYDLANLNQNN